MQQEPLTILWAWETPEDLTALDNRIGVAFLSRELLLAGSGPTAQVTVLPRMNPLHLAPGVWLMAVVRIETAPGFAPGASTATEAADAIAAVSQLPNVRAVQVDFDATASQRDLYLRLLQRLRHDLPATPLSITALVSWCGPHSWLAPLRGMPSPVIDEAVPMFFRMGGPSATRALAPRSLNVITEPLCSTSIGLSTDEAWPVTLPSQRIYLFRSGPWTSNDIATINHLGYQSLHEAPRP
jgi:hypothetical protein